MLQFGDDSDGSSHDEFITNKDREKYERQKKQKQKKNEKTPEQIEEIKKKQMEKQMKSQKKIEENKEQSKLKRGRQDQNKKLKNGGHIEEESKKNTNSNNSGTFNIINEVNQDEHFNNFYNQFNILKMQNQQQNLMQEQNNQIVQMPKFQEEDDYGNQEYKLKFANPNLDRVQHLITQMKFRLNEGNGKAYYMIGLEDNGNPLGLNDQEMYESLATLYYMSHNLNAQLKILKVYTGMQGDIVKIEVYQNTYVAIQSDIKIMIMGSENAGKSTLIGVLISNTLDKGNGEARQNVLRLFHEFVDGRTRCVTQQILGFDSQGKVVNQDNILQTQLSWDQIIQVSSKILTFIDVGGNQKYAKTMIKGICQYYPDYVLIVVSADQGLTNTTKEHIKLALGHELRMVVIITKKDKVNEEKLDEIMEEVKDYINQMSNQMKIVMKIRNQNPQEIHEEITLLCRNIVDEPLIPMFQISNITGEGLYNFTYFLNQLPVISKNSQLWTQNQQDLAEFHISEIIEKKETKEQILGGMVLKGSISVRQQLLLGPDNNGRFRKVEIQNIQCKKVNVKQVIAGQMCSFSINLGEFSQKWIKQGGKIRIGMILIDPKSKPKATYTFEAQLWSLDESPMIVKNNQQPIINIGHVRQAARIIIQKNEQSNLDQGKKQLPSIDESKSNSNSSKEENKTSKNKSKIQNNNNQFNIIKQNTNSKSNQNDEIEITDKKIKIMFQFIVRPEYINLNSRLLINEKSLKVLGRIVNIKYDVENKISFKNQVKRKKSVIEEQVINQNYEEDKFQQIDDNNQIQEKISTKNRQLKSTQELLQ